jgi:hypothetical protein
MLDFLGSKKLKEARQEIETMRLEVTDLKEKIKARRITESSYLFSGDLTPDAVGQSKEQRSDLNTADYWTLQKQCYDCFKLFPYAKRVIEMTTDFCLGSDPTFTVEDTVKAKYKDVQMILEEFWNDYDNNFDLMLEGMTNELWILGEQIYPFEIDPMTRVLKLGIVDPRMVEKILRDDKNPKRLNQIVLQRNLYGKQKVYGVVNEVNGRLRPMDSAMASTPDYEYVAPAFLFQCNRLPTQTRGYSELATMIETLDMLDQFIFQVTERSLLMFHFIADVLIKNKSDEEIKNYPVPDPRKNAVFKHSQNVTLDLKTPDLKAVDADMICRMVVRYILAGVGIPEHWIVSGENTNLSTAREQNNPIEKRLERKQGLVKYMIRILFRAQLEARMTGVTPSEINEIMKGVSINLPAVAGIDRRLRAQVLSETAKSLVIAVSQGWVTNRDAGSEFVALANKFGMELSNLGLEKGLSDIIPGKSGPQNIDGYFKSIDQMVKQMDSTKPGMMTKPQIPQPAGSEAE